ncbi:hypothetical protein [Thiohalomonas denitrificans]|uniref:DUF3592 domain-containing protein n=1 Tax=Thiohalomonas denitrificans TaxID=415747 RepID=A0A1G5QMR7_9GAMM|nr:hypothetical protein [Thiohalomonas denitrificans]SCZ63022.1 hypothetical protein SAMN03097708_02406 [Thiohalomonas denitrificans]
MRALYLFLVVILALTAVFAFMGASANLFEWYEARQEQSPLQGNERVTGRIIDKRVVRQEHVMPSGLPLIQEQHRLYIEIQKGVRAGEVVSKAAPPSQYDRLAVGSEVDVLVGSDKARIVELDYRVKTPTWAFLGIAIFAALGCAALVYRIRRMPLGS